MDVEDYYVASSLQNIGMLFIVVGRSLHFAAV